MAIKHTVYGLPGVYNSTPFTLQSGDGSALAVDENGRLILSSEITDLDIRNLSQSQDNVRIWGNTQKDGGGTNYVPLLDSDGKVVVNLNAAALGQYGNADATAANLTSHLFFSAGLLFNGTTWDRVRGDITNGIDVDVTRVPGLNLPHYDYVSMALSAGDTTETYTFKTGGSGGTTVATIVVVYTSSTRDVLSSVTKT